MTDHDRTAESLLARAPSGSSVGAADADDALEHFHWMIERCCDAARLVAAPVTFELDDGSLVAGTPDPLGRDALPHGAASQGQVVLDGTTVDLARVVRYEIARPGG